MTPIVGVGVPRTPTNGPTPPPPIGVQGPQGYPGALGAQGAQGVGGVTGAQGAQGGAAASLPTVLEWGGTLRGSVAQGDYSLLPWEGAYLSPSVIAYTDSTITLAYPIVVGTGGTLSNPRLSLTTRSLTVPPDGGALFTATLYINGTGQSVVSQLLVSTSISSASLTTQTSNTNLDPIGFFADEVLTAVVSIDADVVADTLGETALEFTVMMTA